MKSKASKSKNRYYLKNIFEEIAKSEDMITTYYNPCEIIKDPEESKIIPETFKEVANEAKIGIAAVKDNIAMLYFGKDLENDILRKELMTVETGNLVITVNDEKIRTRLKQKSLEGYIDIEESKFVNVSLEENIYEKYHGSVKKKFKGVKELIVNLMNL